jgi:uncharacterized repeat protein (TIGR01451 family)
MRRWSLISLSAGLFLGSAAEASPLLQYDFEGNVQDSSGNANHGTVQGTVGYAAGYTGQALSLSGSGWVVMPNNILRGNPNFTVSLRFKTTAYGGILGYQNEVAENPMPWEYVPILAIVPPDDIPGDAGKLRGELWTTAGGLEVLSSSAVNDGGWHQVVLSASATSIVVYLDGAFLGQQTGNVDHLSMQYNQIGTAKIRLPVSGDEYRRFTGLIDDLVITTDYLPEVSTQAVTAIDATSATGNGNVTNLGSPNPTQHGVCWSTSQNPTIADSKTTDGPLGATGAFTSSITGLTASTTYYVRAYATNDAGTRYGSQVQFTTDSAPTVTTAAVSDVTASTASGGGNVTADGGDAVTARGVCWSTNANPTIADTKTTDGTGTGAFVSSITGLSPGTTYHVRAYATNSIGTSYGSDVSFATGIDVTTSGGSASYTLGGSAVPVDPALTLTAGTITDFKVSVTANFAAGDVLAYTGALPGGVGASYSSGTGVLTFSGSASAADWQALLRTVTFETASASAATRTIAFTAGGAIPYSGNGHFYEYVSSPNINWTNARNAAAARTLFGLQGYLATITSQEENDFIRQKLGADAWIGGSDADAENVWKWVTGPEAGTQFSNDSTPVGGQFANWNTGEPNNSGGNEDYAEIYSTDGVGKWNDLPDMSILDGYVTEYGDMPGDPTPQITDTRDVTITAPVAPTVTTAEISGITTTTAQCGGNVTDDGGAAVTARGVCWNTTGAPTVADYKTADGTGTGAFVSGITGLLPGATYHVRAYATNSAGTSYGDGAAFSTWLPGEHQDDAPDDDPGGDEPADGGDNDPGDPGDQDGDGNGGVTAPDLRVTLVAPTQTANVGDDLSFHVNVQNLGNGGATNVILRVPLPAGTEFVGARLVTRGAGQSAPLNAYVEGDQIVIELGDVGAGEGLELELLLEAKASGVVTLEASVSSDEQPTPATGLASSNVDDVYWEVVNTFVPMCGAVGIAPLLILMGLVGMKRRGPGRSESNRVNDHGDSRG